jgi:hypothetical protein
MSSSKNGKQTQDRIQTIANHLDPKNKNKKKDEALEKSEWRVDINQFF